MNQETLTRKAQSFLSTQGLAQSFAPALTTLLWSTFQEGLVISRRAGPPALSSTGANDGDVTKVIAEATEEQRTLFEERRAVWLRQLKEEILAREEYEIRALTAEAERDILLQRIYKDAAEKFEDRESGS